MRAGRVGVALERTRSGWKSQIEPRVVAPQSGSTGWVFVVPVAVGIVPTAVAPAVMLVGIVEHADPVAGRFDVRHEEAIVDLRQPGHGGGRHCDVGGRARVALESPR